jgi:hypothetical protein
MAPSIVSIKSAKILVKSTIVSSFKKFSYKVFLLSSTLFDAASQLSPQTSAYSYNVPSAFSATSTLSSMVSQLSIMAIN